MPRIVVLIKKKNYTDNRRLLSIHKPHLPTARVTFPTLPVVPEGSPIGYRPIPASKPSTVNEQPDSMEFVDFNTNVPFGNLLIILSLFGASNH